MLTTELRTAIMADWYTNGRVNSDGDVDILREMWPGPWRALVDVLVATEAWKEGFAMNMENYLIDEGLLPGDTEIAIELAKGAYVVGLLERMADYAP